MIKNKIKKLVVGMMLTFAVAGAAFAAVGAGGLINNSPRRWLLAIGSGSLS